MKIFMFASSYPVPFKPYYDTQFADLVERGHDLTIFSSGALDEDVLNEKVLRYGLHRRTRRYPASLSDVPGCVGAVLRAVASRPAASARAIGRMAAKRRTWGSVRSFVRNVARLLSVADEEPDLCFVHGLGTATRFRWLRESFPGVPVAMYYHGGEVPSVPDLSDDAARATFACFDTVFTNTGFSRDHAIQRGCDPNKLHVLPVGFDLEDFPPPAGAQADNSEPLRLLSAGRMSEEKGYAYALEALARLAERGVADFLYSMTGEGYLRPELEAYVREYGLEDRVRFLGTLTTDELREEMRLADVLLLPSVQVGNWVENQACAVQEALLHGCLVVTTRTGGVPESIPDCMKEFSVPERDPDALADAVEKVLALGYAERRELAARCRRFVVENYDVRELNDRMLSTIFAEGDEDE